MPTEILRPAGVGALDELAISGAATAWECIDDAVADDNTTRIQHNNTTAARTTCTIDATALTTETITSLDLWHRSAHNSSGGGDDFTWGVLRLGGTTSDLTQRTLSSASNTYNDYEDAAAARPGGGSWTVADLSTLEIGARAYETGAGAARVTQVYLEVNYTAGGGDPEGSLIGGKLIRGGLLLHGVLGR
jgi:hypothetical protein